MTDRGCTAPIEFVDIVDYWTGDLPRTTTEAIEEHMFTCAECAHQLAEGEALARGIAAVVREGRFHAIVTDAFLNRLAQEGRSNSHVCGDYVLEHAGTFNRSTEGL